MPRLFTAIELSAHARAAIVRHQRTLAARLRNGAGALRPTPEAQLHLTLVFIGQVDEGRAEAIVDALRAGIPLSPFTVTFGAAGVFPPRGRARVLWLAVADGARELALLHALTAARLDAAGVRAEERPYHPHLTIGRWRAGEGPGRVALPPAAAVAAAPVDAVTLFESRLRPGGAEHVALARCPLDGLRRDPLH